MIVGNHSYSHPAFSSLTIEQAKAEIEEYRIWQSDFTVENVWAKIKNMNPTQGAALLAEDNYHFILTHAHDETEEVVPGYIMQFVDYCLENGMTFDKPTFFM